VRRGLEEDDRCVRGHGEEEEGEQHREPGHGPTLASL
jgi:hypothetical protein